ncbi:MAG: hypothetical protein RLZZ387_1457, partial [Chloroflexota bacterium]
MRSLTRHALRAVALLTCAAAACGFYTGVQAQQTQSIQPRVFVSMVMTPGDPPAFEPPAVEPTDWLAWVNHYRAVAGVPPVTDDAELNDNCWQHARYMAENNHLAHAQDSTKPYASPAGNLCASKADVWIAQSTRLSPPDSVEGWMASAGHRLWLIYPTTTTFGYGFYTSASRQAAALDVLSHTRFEADTRFTGWPLRYPAADQVGVRSDRYPVTLLWRYFGSAPQLTSTRLSTEAGAPIAHSADTNLPAGHKGVQIVPSADLPDNTVIIVEVNGSYERVPFSYTWRFTTSGEPSAASSLEAAPGSFQAP